MQIYQQAVKIKHQDYYRKKYWDNNLYRRQEFKRLGYLNEIGVDKLGDSCELLFTMDAIKSHTDFPGTCYLLILHNYCYQFEYNRELYHFNSGDIIEFDLMVMHGLIKYKSGRNLFLGISVDAGEFEFSDVEYIKTLYAPFI